MTTKYLKTISLSAIMLTSICTWAAQDKREDRNSSAHQVSVKLSNLSLEGLPVWDKDVAKDRFDEIRDKKFLEFEGKKRRIPWLYARDGCHMRSTHFTLEAERLGYEVPKKIFIFGVLEIKGAIIPRGAVQPWFHAAPIVQVDGEPMVLDPSISFSRPLSLETWISYVALDKSKTVYSICDANTYLPTSNCSNPGPLDMKMLNEETQLFLRFERNIMSNLGLVFE